MAEHLTEEQLREMKLIFNMFDSNGNGVIDAGELERLLHAMNQNPTPEELEEFLVDLDPEGTGEISFEMFLEYAPSKFRSEDEEMSMVKEAFRVFDKDGSGYITIDEAKSILQRGENSISDEDLQEFFNQSDLDKDGQINYEEFALILNERFSPESYDWRSKQNMCNMDQIYWFGDFVIYCEESID